MEWDEFENNEPVDIDATIEALRAAWKITPTVSLYELLDMVTHMPFVELSNQELLDALNEFVHQNE